MIWIRFMGIKAHSAYMSLFQLIPYNRIQDHFADQLHMPVSEGFIFNFNKEAFEQDGQKWAQDMKELLETINHKVSEAGGALDAFESQKYRQKYRALITQANIECPEPVKPKKLVKRGRIKKS